MKEITKYALLDAVATAFYIVLVVFFISTIGKHLGDKPDNILAPIFMLLLFVFSAALTGILVFGRPIIWYLNSKKKEAVSLLLLTLAFIFVITIIAFIFMIIVGI